MKGLVRIKALKLKAEAQLPRYAHVGAFGDLAADLYAAEAVVIEAGVTLPVSTGIALEFPATHGALVEDRSGLAVRGVTTLAGVIDPGYRGEIKVVVTNLSAGLGRDQSGRSRWRSSASSSESRREFEEVTELAEAPRGAAGLRQHRRLARPQGKR